MRADQLIVRVCACVRVCEQLCVYICVHVCGTAIWTYSFSNSVGESNSMRPGRFVVLNAAHSVFTLDFFLSDNVTVLHSRDGGVSERTRHNAQQLNTKRTRQDTDTDTDTLHTHTHYTHILHTHTTTLHCTSAYLRGR